MYPQEETTTEGPFYDQPIPGALSKIGGLSSRMPLSQQEKAIAELHETIDTLVARLKPILTPVNEVAANRVGERGEEAKDLASPLADQMKANNRGIHRATQNLRGIMDRLEC